VDLHQAGPHRSDPHPAGLLVDGCWLMVDG
jgi:hypothetical protein